MSERQTGQDGTADRSGKIAEEIQTFRCVAAVGELREDESGDALRNSDEGKLSEMTVEFADRFADIFEHKKRAGEVGEPRGSAKGGKKCQIDRNERPVRGTVLQNRQGNGVAGGEFAVEGGAECK